MGSQIHLFISDLSAEDSKQEDGTYFYTCQTGFEFSKWCNWAFLNHDQPGAGGVMWIGTHGDSRKIKAYAIPEGMRIEACWINKVEARSWCHEDDTMFRLTTADQLKGIKWHEDDWHPSVVTHSKMATAAIESLPDDWPIIIYIV